MGVVLFTQYFFVTYGTWHLFASESRGIAYDSLAKSLLLFRADVEPDSINWEGLDIGKKKFMYFGPWPALLRIPLNYLWPQHYGEWSRLSCLAGSILTLIPFLLLCHCIMSRGRGYSTNVHNWLICFFCLAFGLGTPLFYLISCGRIYHEAIIWGLAGSTWGIFAIVGLLEKLISPKLALVTLSIAAGIALLARLTFGAPLYGLLLIGFIGYVFAGGKGQRNSLIKKLLVAATCLMPALLAGLFQAWYNYERFGSALQTMDFSATYFNTADFGGTLNLRRLPDAIINYLGFNWSCFSKFPPFFLMAIVSYATPSLFFDWREPTFSLLLGSSWLLFGSFCGGLLIIKERSFLRALALIVLFSQAICIFSYGFVTQRFSAELLPLLIFCFAFFLKSRWPTHRPMIAVLSTLAISSIITTTLSTISWHILFAAPGTDIPQEWPSRLRSYFFSKQFYDLKSDEKLLLTAIKADEIFYDRAEPRFVDSTNGQTITIHDVEYGNGIAMHANSKITFSIPNKAQYFMALAGLDRHALRCGKTSLIIKILDENGAILFNSGLLGSNGIKLPDGSPTVYHPNPFLIKIPLNKSKKIILSITDGGDNSDCDMGNFILPAFIF